LAIVIRELEVRDRGALDVARSRWDGATGFVFLPRWEDARPFEDYVELLKDQRLGLRLPEGFVPDTCLFAFRGDEIVGRVSVRHRLNEHLLRVGGHIGYGVLPEYRGQGIATRLLRRGLEEARALGIGRVLVTCDDTNAASARVIEKCGGVLEDVTAVPGGVGKRRYWIGEGGSASDGMRPA
jgi:predicted acetyltransferase